MVSSVSFETDGRSCAGRSIAMDSTALKAIACSSCVARSAVDADRMLHTYLRSTCTCRGRSLVTENTSGLLKVCVPRMDVTHAPRFSTLHSRRRVPSLVSTDPPTDPAPPASTPAHAHNAVAVAVPYVTCTRVSSSRLHVYHFIKRPMQPRHLFWAFDENARTPGMWGASIWAPIVP